MATLKFYIPEQEFEFEVEGKEEQDFRLVLSGDEDGEYACFEDAIANYELEVHARIDIDVELVDD